MIIFQDKTPSQITLLTGGHLSGKTATLTAFSKGGLGVFSQSLKSAQLIALWQEFDPKTQSQALEYLKRLMPQIERLTVDGSALLVHATKTTASGNEVLSTQIQSSSDGIRRAVEIIIKLLAAPKRTAAGRFLVIDNIEQSLHYSILNPLWQIIFEVAGKHKLYIMASTQSADCIEAFNRQATKSKLDCMLFRLGRNPKDASKSVVVGMSKSELATMLSMGMDVR